MILWNKLLLNISFLQFVKLILKIWTLKFKVEFCFCEYILQNFSDTAQKMKFSIKDVFSEFDQIRRKLQI